MKTRRRIGVLIAALMIAGCAGSPAPEPPGENASPQTVRTAPPTVTPMTPAVRAPSLSPSAAPAPEEPSDYPVFQYLCARPTTTVYDDILGQGFLFDPQAAVIFSGSSAEIQVTIDGFLAQETTLSQDPPVGADPQPVDLTREFYDTRSDEDRYNGVSGRQTHVIVAVLVDDRGRSVTNECTLEVSFP